MWLTVANHRLFFALNYYGLASFVSGSAEKGQNFLRTLYTWSVQDLTDRCVTHELYVYNVLHALDYFWCLVLPRSIFDATISGARALDPTVGLKLPAHEQKLLVLRRQMFAAINVSQGFSRQERMAADTVGVPVLPRREDLIANVVGYEPHLGVFLCLPTRCGTSMSSGDNSTPGDLAIASTSWSGASPPVSGTPLLDGLFRCEYTSSCWIFLSAPHSFSFAA